MSKRLSIVCLLAAWLCADGTLLDVAQVAAWARMFAGYAQTYSIAESVALTVDPGRPCDLCKALQRARETTEKHPASATMTRAEKIVLAQPESASLTISPPAPGWTECWQQAGPERIESVPVPPPRVDLGRPLV